MSLEPIILSELQRGGPPLWVAGRTYRKGQCVLSPTDAQVYVRTVPGAGADDPKIDSGHWERSGATIEAAVARLSEAVDSVGGDLADVASKTNAIGAAVAGINAVWTPGRVIKRGEEVLSPLDWETYRRIAADGSGATDPADDTVNYTATSFERCLAMVARGSGLQPNGGSIGAANYGNGATRTTPGAIAIGVRTSVLSLTGRGALTFLGLYFQSQVTLRVEVMVDGRTVGDFSLVPPNSAYVCTLFGQTSRLDSWAEYYAIPDAHGLPFRRGVQVFFTVSAGSWPAGGTLAYSFRSIA